MKRPYQEPQELEDSRWSRHDLELFLDGELGDTRRAAVAAALRRSPALRATLADVTRQDERMRSALAGEPSSARSQRDAAHATGTLAIFARRRLAVAVAAGLAITTWAAWPSDNPSAGDRPTTDRNPAGTYKAVRVVYAGPLRDRTADEATTDRAPARTAARPQRDREKATRHAPRFAVPTPPRSAQEAERILDALEPAKQVEVCRQWCLSPGVRPVVFARIAALSTRPALKDQVGTLIDDLAADPQLARWLRGYRIVS